MPVADTVTVELDAKVAGYERDLRHAQQTFSQTNQGIASSAARTSQLVIGHIKSMIAAYVGIQGAQMALGFIDASSRITNSLKTSGLAGEELKLVYDELFASAQRNSTPLEALAGLYGRAALSAKELGLTQQELLKFTDNVALALRVAGRSAAESSGALLQLSQALGAGTVRAEEFNSLLEGALPIAQAAAAGLEEAGGSVARLRALVVDGKVSSEAFFRAFEAGAGQLAARVATSTSTSAQGFIGLENALVDAFGKFDAATGVSRAMGSALSTLGNAVQQLGDWFEENKAPIQEFFAAIQDGINKIPGFKAAFEEWAARSGRDLGMALGVNTTGRGGVFGGGEAIIDKPSGSFAADLAAAERTRNLELAREDARAQGAALLGRSRNAPTTGTVSLTDFDADTTAADAAKKAAEAQVKWQAALASVRDMTKAVQDEAAAEAMGTEEATKFLAVQDLLKQARDIGIAITPEVTRAINEEAAAYAAATAEAEKLAAAQDKLDQLVEGFQSTAESLLSGFIQDLRQGKSATEALGNSLNKLADMLIDMAVKQLVANALGALLGGTAYGGSVKPGPIDLAGLPGLAFGTANTGGQRGQVRGVVHGQEAVIPLPNGGRVPVQMMGNGGGAPVINIHDHNNNDMSVGRGPDGEIEITMRALARDEMASSRSNAVFGAKYGVRPAVRRRG